MAYTNTNLLQQQKQIIEVYNQVKEADIPDTYIVKHIFPKHNIFICYRKWMSIKGMKPSDFASLTDLDQLISTPTTIHLNAGCNLISKYKST